MAYVDLGADVCEHQFDIFKNDSTDEFKIMYILKKKRFGVLKKISAYIPKDSPFLYKSEYDMDSEYLDLTVPKKTDIYTSKSQLKRHCYSPIFVVPTTTIHNKFYYCVQSTDKTRFPQPLVIKKNPTNIWQVTYERKIYMEMLFNYGLGKRTGEPDLITMYMPNYENEYINYVWTSPYTMYINDSDRITAYMNKEPRFNYRRGNYELHFKVSNAGVSSEKNSCIIPIDKEDSEPSLEALKLSRDVISVVYKKPFSSLHAFAYGVARCHSSYN